MITHSGKPRLPRRGFFLATRFQPAEQQGGQNRADKLGRYEGRRVSEAEAGETVGNTKEQ